MGDSQVTELVEFILFSEILLARKGQIRSKSFLPSCEQNRQPLRAHDKQGKPISMTALPNSFSHHLQKRTKTGLPGLPPHSTCFLIQLQDLDFFSRGPSLCCALAFWSQGEDQGKHRKAGTWIRNTGQRWTSRYRKKEKNNVAGRQPLLYEEKTLDSYRLVKQNSIDTGYECTGCEACLCRNPGTSLKRPLPPCTGQKSVPPKFMST